MSTATSLILVINCGSSSLKFALQPLSARDPVLTGLAECLGLEDARITFKTADGRHEESLGHGRHAEAMAALTRYLGEQGLLAQVVAIGHRIVHGGERFHASVIVDEEVIAGIEACCELAPLHNPGHLVGIRAAQAAFPGLPQVTVFDTAFHQTMQPSAYRYAIPKRFYQAYGVRRYGMHGTSCRYVTNEAVRLLGLDPDTVRFAPDNRAAPGRSANAPDWLHLSPPADAARQEMEQAARRGHYDPAYWPARPPCRLCLICHRFGRQRAPCRTGP